MRGLCWLALLITLTAGGAESADRIASFSPAATRILVDLDAGDEIVAATRWCELPQGHPARRSCDAFEPDIEALRLSGATVAILPRLANPMLEARVRSVGLRTLVLAAESAESPAEDIAALARLTGRTEVGDRLLQARRQCPRPATGKRVLVLWDGVCAGPDSYLAWAIRAAGGEPAPGKGAWPQWDIESVTQANPDLVLVLKNDGPNKPETDKTELQRWQDTPGLRLTHAAQAGCVYHVKCGSDWLPASGLPNAVVIIAKLLAK